MAQPPGPKQLYIRHFPYDLRRLLDHLSERELRGYLNLSVAYAESAGDMADDEENMTRATKLSKSAWAALASKLIASKFGRIEDGKWIDDSQNLSFGMQRNASERARKGAGARKRVSDEP
jgi:uncharacterized protein YdaU (DUF1376 family)